VTNIVLLLEDIAAIYTRNKLVYVIDRDHKKYLIDKKLMELEEQLDEDIFFRANRQYIININFVKSFSPFERVKLRVELNITGFEEDVIISQHVAPAFKKWMNDA
jgi:DNA-binding LytR/AlgR family response regulator